MAIQQAAIPTVPDVQMIGAAFVNRYYNVLVSSPESLHKFYQDFSIVGRQDSSGQMMFVTTVGAIKKLVTSLANSALEVEIKTTDSLLSYNNAVLVLVSGSITFKNRGTRAFSQIFFLVPQQGGYFLLNDVVRYLDDAPQRQNQNPSEETAKENVDSGPLVKPEELGQNGVSEQSITKEYAVSGSVVKPEELGQNGVSEQSTTEEYAVSASVVMPEELGQNGVSEQSRKKEHVISGSVVNPKELGQSGVSEQPAKKEYAVSDSVVKPEELGQNSVSEQSTTKEYSVSGSVVKPEELGQNGVSEQSTTVLEEPAHVVEEVHKNRIQDKETTEDSAGQKVTENEHAQNGEPPRPQETPVEVQPRQKTYASVVKQNAAQPTVAIQKPTILAGMAVANSAQRPATSSISTAPSANPVNRTGKSNAQKIGFSIFINNLPVNVTASQVGEEFKKFGAIKPSGIQVKIRPGSESSFGFVEFEETASVQRAINASPIQIGDRQVFIREKRPHGEGLTNDGERRRGVYPYAVQGNGRNDFVNNRAGGGSFPGRSSGSFSGAGQDGYQRENNKTRNGGRDSQRGSTFTNNVRNPRT